MAELGSPSRHTTTVTSNTTVQTNIRFDSTYLRTFPGILKCVQAASSLLVFILIQATPYALLTVGSVLCVISMIGFWCTLILLVLYIFHLIEKFYRIPWLKFEMIYCLAMAVLFLIMAPQAIVEYSALFKTAGVIGLISMLVYAFDAFLKYRDFRSGRLAQGERVVIKTTTTY